MASDRSLTFPLNCPGGGTMDMEGSQININDCVTTSESGTEYLGRGTYTVSESGSLVTHEWSQDLIVAGGTTFSSTGSISFDTLDDLVAFDFSATFSSGVFRFTGIVANNADDTSDLTLSVMQDGVTWLDCSFDDSDLNALTDDLVDTACADDDDPACSTLECSNDFQCQVFADNDQTDEFTTGNTQCVSGCCSLVEATVSCAANTISCTTDFQCQMFADDDQTDEFTTSNVECSGGCCTLIAE
ncbi:MAG: hypothetical protein HYT75_06345 [Deltaproteobacteria bacterium]|nr:hypothetical protein [Deltaproteobacteria bacterium]MBI2342579.1 hypothetical protein [Deltaproteobacteria bacterium]